MSAEDRQNNPNDPLTMEISNCRALVCPVINSIASTFGRLAFVASLRNTSSDVYWHPAATGIFETQIVDQVLRQEHLNAFEAWLSLKLEEQAADLAAHLLGHENCSEILQQWRQESSCIKLVPATALEPERKLFRSDLELILSILCEGQP